MVTDLSGDGRLTFEESTLESLYRDQLKITISTLLIKPADMFSGGDHIDHVTKV